MGVLLLVTPQANFCWVTCGQATGHCVACCKLDLIPYSGVFETILMALPRALQVLTPSIVPTPGEQPFSTTNNSAGVEILPPRPTQELLPWATDVPVCLTPAHAGCTVGVLLPVSPPAFSCIVTPGQATGHCGGRCKLDQISNFDGV